MKRFIITLFFVVTIQNINGQQKQDIDLITSGKWYLEYVGTIDNKEIVPEGKEKNNWMIFYSSGKLESMTMGNQNISNWEYLKNKNSLKMIDKGQEIVQKIVKINEKEFVLSFLNENKEIYFGFKK